MSRKKQNRPASDDLPEDPDHRELMKQFNVVIRKVNAVLAGTSRDEMNLLNNGAIMQAALAGIIGFAKAVCAANGDKAPSQKQIVNDIIALLREVSAHVDVRIVAPVANQPPSLTDATPCVGSA